MSANETSGLQGRVTVKIMVIAYKKDKALCSPTSALEKKRINVKRGADGILSDGQRQAYIQCCDYSGETSASFVCPRLSYIIRKIMRHGRGNRRLISESALATLQSINFTT
jgi:predicted type IV restriction endonuclease